MAGFKLPESGPPSLACLGRALRPLPAACVRTQVRNRNWKRAHTGRSRAYREERAGEVGGSGASDEAAKLHPSLQSPSGTAEDPSFSEPEECYGYECAACWHPPEQLQPHPAHLTPSARAFGGQQAGAWREPTAMSTATAAQQAGHPGALLDDVPSDCEDGVLFNGYEAAACWHPAASDLCDPPLDISLPAFFLTDVPSIFHTLELKQQKPRVNSSVPSDASHQKSSKAASAAGPAYESVLRSACVAPPDSIDEEEDVESAHAHQRRSHGLHDMHDVLASLDGMVGNYGSQEDEDHQKHAAPLDQLQGASGQEYSCMMAELRVLEILASGSSIAASLSMSSASVSVSGSTGGSSASSDSD